jgi:hypothetical protein
MHQFAPNMPQCDTSNACPMLFPRQIPQLYNANKGKSHHARETLLLDNALLVCISADSIIVLTELRALPLPHEILVMDNDDELEILLLTSILDDLIQRLSESSNVVLIKIRRRFAKSNDLASVSVKSSCNDGNTYTAILTETLCKSKTDDDTS